MFDSVFPNYTSEYPSGFYIGFKFLVAQFVFRRVQFSGEYCHGFASSEHEFKFATIVRANIARR